MQRLNALLMGVDWFPYDPAGLNRYFYELVHALPDVNVGGIAAVTYTRFGESAPMPLRGMAGQGASIARQLKGARGLGIEAIRDGAQIVNAHFAKFAYPLLSSLPPSVPLVVNFQGPWADEMALETRRGWKSKIRVILARLVERKVYHRAARLIALSESFRQILHSRYAVPLDRIDVIPGAVRVESFESAPERSAARAALGLPMGRPILLAVRRLIRRTGVDVLIDAMELVRRDHPNALLLIAGKGPLEQELDARIARHGIEHNVRRIGFVADQVLPLAYAAADLTVVPSVALEGFGLITVESLACGTPVMGTPVGGTPEILRGLDARLVFDGPSAAEVAAGLVRALSGELPLPDSAACRNHAAEFAWSKVVLRVRETFDRALSEAACPARA